MLVLIVTTSLAQDRGARAHATQIVKSTSTLVIVPTLVKTESGELIRDLEAGHFRLTDNGEQRAFWFLLGTPLAGYGFFVLYRIAEGCAQNVKNCP